MTLPPSQSGVDIGIEWIGKTPSSWALRPLKGLFEIVGGSTPKSDQEAYWDGDVVWITPTDLGRNEIADLSESQRTITQEGLASCGTVLVPPGSIILSTRAPIGSLGIALVSLCTNQGCKALVPHCGADTRFFAYLLSAAKELLRLRGKGTTFLELSGDELGAFKVPLPPHGEQTAIAEFLDRETGKIDALVEEKKRLIELLKEKRQAVISHAVTKGLNPHAKMKDSGVKWLGEVPKHWRVGRLKHFAEVRGRIGFRGYTAEDIVAEGEGALALGGANLSGDGSVSLDERTYLSWAKYEESPEIKIERGDILIGQRGTCGRVSLVDKDLGPATINPSLVVLKNIDVDASYLALWLMGDIVQQTFASYLSKTAVPMLSQEQISSVPAVAPPPDEQSKIAAYLSDATGQIDRLIADSEAATILLQERRAALISAAVTGKIDAREAVEVKRRTA